MIVSTIWLIQSTQNGYVHCAFNTLRAAQRWIAIYESKTTETRHPYDIVERFVYSNPHDIQ